MKKVLFILSILIAWNNEVLGEKIQISTIGEIGVAEARKEIEKPYQFSFINSITCDKDGNISEEKIQKLKE